MKKIIILILLFPCFALSNDINKNLENYLDECYKQNIFSGSIVILNNFKPVFEKSYGSSNFQLNNLNSFDTKYNIASIGKMFTLTLILQLIEEGKLDVNDKISKYLDLFNNEKFKDVTVKHLITHSSGFGDFINPEFIRNKNNYNSLNDILKLISESNLSFPPGSEKKYSNSGYCILGGIVESITGKSFGAVMNEKIFKILEMNNTEYKIPSDSDQLKAVGYIQGIKGNFNPTNNMLIGSTPAGGVYSTINDMLKFNFSLFNDNKLLTDKSKLLLFSEFEDVKYKTFSDMINDPGFGSMIAGGAPGFNSLYLLLPSKGYSGFIFSNFDNGAERIEKGIVDILNGKTPEIPKPMFGIYLYKKLTELGNEYFINNINTIIKESNVQIKHDGVLNNIGYQFLNNGLINEAIAIFKYNVEIFPNISNCYDSLAEAYLESGDKTKAIEYYELALKLDPENERITDTLNKLNKLSR